MSILVYVVCCTVYELWIKVKRDEWKSNFGVFKNNEIFMK